MIGYIISRNANIVNNKIRYATESEYNINRYSKLLKNLDIDHDIEFDGKSFIITLKLKNVIQNNEFNLSENLKFDNDLITICNYNEISKNEKKSIIKGSFLGAGSINNPDNNYHLEINVSNSSNLEFLNELLKEFEINTKKLIMDNKYSIYLKDGEEISKLLALMGANKAVLKFEDIRVQKNIRGKVNRIVNCQTANLNKTINAAVEQIEAIKKLQKEKRFNKLNENLKEIAIIRLVITIIILIILAAITVVAITGDNGIFSSAKEAVNKTEYASAKESLEIKLMEIQTECIAEGKEYNIQEVARYIGKDEETTVELMKYYALVASLGNGVERNTDLSTVTGVVVAVKQYSKYKFLIGKDCKISGVKVGDISSTTEMTEFQGVEEFEATIGKNEEPQETIVNFVAEANGWVKNAGNKGKIVGKITTSKGNITSLTIQKTGGTDTDSQIAYYTYSVKSGNTELNSDTTLRNNVISNVEKGNVTISVIAYDNVENASSVKTKEITLGDKITVSGTYNETTGETFLDLESYIDSSKDGDTIYIPEGIYRLPPIKSTHSYANDQYIGIHDKGKKLTFVGQNEKTILRYYNIDCTTNQHGELILLMNSESIIRNLVLDYYPSKSASYGNAIFSHTKGSISNVYIKDHNTTVNTRYVYTNHSYQDFKVYNCTFYFEDTTKIDNDYAYNGGVGTSYYNIFTNYEPPSANLKSNIVTKSILDNIQSTKTDSDAVTNQVGVYYGEYAWD